MARGPRPGDLNQALMELGATLCTPRAPACPDCPIVARCMAKASGEPELWPRRGERPAIVEARAMVAVLARGRSVLLARRSESSPLRGDWDLPAVEIRSSTGGAAALSRALAEHGLVIELHATRIVLRHAILNRALTLEVLAGRVLRGRVAGSDALRWANPEEIPRTVPVSGATRKVLAAVGADGAAFL
jgi:A/G-specific adenine glycosylase